MKTRATQLKAPGQIVLAERELTVGPEEVLVKGHLSGICGSDKAMYRGDIPDKITLPLWIGHESGGTIVEVGSKVREYRPGDKVTLRVLRGDRTRDVEVALDDAMSGAAGEE